MVALGRARSVEFERGRAEIVCFFRLVERPAKAVFQLVELAAGAVELPSVEVEEGPGLGSMQWARVRRVCCGQR